jgi:DNA-binding MarR family transcriptional regulator
MAAIATGFGVDALRLDSYIVDTLLPDLVGHDRQPSAFLVYLFLWRRAQDGSGAAVRIPLRDVAEGTGLSKRAVQEALARLVQRGLVEVAREGITAVAAYTVRQPWRR